MANLILTAACNQTCRYCFARDVLSHYGPESIYMNPGDFEQVLDFLGRSGIDQVRLLGGEPTLHPQFPALVGTALRGGLRILVFSNGLIPESALRCLEEIPPDRAAVLINVSSFKGLEAPVKARQTNTLRRLGLRATLGLTVDGPGLEIDFLLDLIREFYLSRSIRFGLAHPGVDGANHFLHPRNYPEVGMKLAAFAGEASQSGVQLRFDCGFVPCMFPPGSMEILAEGAGDIGVQCSPILDILPDGHVIPCFPLAGVHRDIVPQNRDAAWLRGQFEDKLKPYRHIGIYRQCNRCEWRENKRCMGGCLASALRRLRRTEFRTPVAPVIGKGRSYHG